MTAPGGSSYMRVFIKILYVLSVFLCLGFKAAAQELDPVQRKALSDKLAEYFAAIEREGTEVQKQECDFLIGSSEDSLVRQFIALEAYEHYMESPVMGSEAVAIHVLDNWFIPGKVKMKSDIDLINARVYADFNRQSPVGEKAPGLVMKNPEGQEVVLFGEGPGSSGSGRYSILYFYDTDCSKCKVETILLRNILEDNDYPVDLIAVYSGDDGGAWASYASGQLAVDSDKVNVIHLWDPELDSDFQRKYGVLQTPRIFLVRPDGVILGRGLDSEALYTMLRGIFKKKELNYGSDESASLFDGILATDDGKGPDRQRVCDLVDYISSGTLQKGDTLMFRQLSGDLLYYLATRPGEGIKEGLKYLIDESINGCPEAWNSQDDSLKVVGFAAIMDDLLSKAMPGTMIPDLKLPAHKLTSGKSRTGKYRLRKLKGARNIIIFHTPGCDICKAEKEAACMLAETDRRICVLMVNVDYVISEKPAVADRMFDLFDLSSLPYIIETDRAGIILKRYTTCLL